MIFCSKEMILEWLNKSVLPIDCVWKQSKSGLNPVSLEIDDLCFLNLKYTYSIEIFGRFFENKQLLTSMR